MEKNIYNERYIEFITPELKRFWENEKENFEASHYPYGLFLPHAFDKYQESSKKIFYIGQDAFYWVEGSVMKDLFEKGHYDEYIRQNNDVMASVDKKLAWGNGSGAFWPMVIKLHLLINTGEWMDLSKLREKHCHLIQSLGYGNINSLATKRTLQTFLKKDDIDFSKYGEVREYIFRIERLKHIIDIFSPDYVVILCHNISPYQEDNYFKDLNIQWFSDEKLEQYIITGEIRNHKECKIIWCPNPNHYRFLGTNMHEMATLIRNNISI